MRARILPGEWVLGAFLLYAFGRLVVAHDFSLNQRSIPHIDLVLGLSVVLCVRLYVDYRRTPWPESARGQRVPHLAFLFVFLAFVPLVSPKLPSLRPTTGGWEGSTTNSFLQMYGWVQLMLLVFVPFLIFWLASAQRIKSHGRISTIGMLRDGFRPTLATLREWLPLMALFYCYGLMAPVIGKGLFGDQDVALERIDRAMFFGHDPRVLCEALISRPLSEWLSGCYVAYVMLFPVVLTFLFAKRDPAPFREVSFAVVLAMAIGFVFYTVVPAQGPLFMDHFDVSLDAYLMAPIKEELMDRTRVPRDCFPSLHTAGSLTLLWGAFRYVRPLFLVLTPIVLSIPFACVYLRYHYVIDILAGIALFAFVATVSVHSKWLQAAFHRPAEG